MRLVFRCLIGTLTGIAIHLSLLSAAEPAVPILVYHRFGPVRTDSMTVTTELLQEQIDQLCKNNFSVIPLADFIAWRLGKDLRRHLDRSF